MPPGYLCLDWILSHVAHDSAEVIRVPNNAVITLLSPQRTRSPQLLIYPSRRKLLPTPDDGFETDSIVWLYYRVAVIRHDHGRAEEIPLALELAHCRQQQIGILLLLEKAVTISLIQPVFGQSGVPASVRLPVLFTTGFGMHLFPGLSKLAKLAQFRLGQRVVEAEGDEIGRPRLSPMR